MTKAMQIMIKNHVVVNMLGTISIKVVNTPNEILVFVYVR